MDVSGRLLSKMGRLKTVIARRMMFFYTHYVSYQLFPAPGEGRGWFDTLYSPDKKRLSCRPDIHVHTLQYVAGARSGWI